MTYLDSWSEIGNYGQGLEAYVYWSSQFEKKYAENWCNFWKYLADEGEEESLIYDPDQAP